MNPTLRYSLIYGGLSAAVLVAFIAVIGTLAERVDWVATQTFGYSVMLVAMSFVFVGVKRYRDVEGGGVISVWRALGLGLLIALIGCLAYVVIWEGYLAATGYKFMDNFIAKLVRDAHAAGKSAAEIARITADFEPFRKMYANPLIRMSMTFMEVAPVGLVVSVFSTILCFPRVLPSRDATERRRQASAEQEA